MTKASDATMRMARTLGVDFVASNAAAAAAHVRTETGPTILFGDGSYFDYADPEATTLTIEDYAWALAGTNRFRCQTRLRAENGAPGRRVLYNVCQHVVMLAMQMLRDDHSFEAAFQGLMHESDEVAWGDFTSPSKRMMPAEMKALVKASGVAIDRRFGVGSTHKDIVKSYDIRMLATEKRDLMPHAEGHAWSGTATHKPFRFTITPWDPDYAVTRFLSLHAYLDDLRGEA